MRHEAAGCGVLLRALASRGLAPEVVKDEPAAMLALAGTGRRGVERRVLVVVEPRQWGRLGELVAAVRTFHRGVYCWQFATQADAEPMLSPIEVAPGEADAHDVAGPIGVIRRRPRAVDQLLVSGSDRELSTREVVTRQELTMLLGPVPGEAG